MESTEEVSFNFNNRFITRLKNFIGNDTKWVIELFDIIKKKTELEFHHSHINTSHEEESQLFDIIVLYIFVKILVKIMEPGGKHYLITDISEVNEYMKSAKSFVPIPPEIKIPYSLNHRKINTLINDYLSFSKIFLDFIKDDRVYFSKEFKTLLKVKQKLVLDLMQKNKSGTIASDRTNKYLNKGKVGAKPKFTKEEFKRKFLAIPKDKRNSFNKVAKELHISTNTAIKYIRADNTISLSTS